MTQDAEDLTGRLTALTERFAGLATKLARATQELEGPGVLPAESLVEEVGAARGEFADLRSRVLDAARSLSVTTPAPDKIVSLAALRPVLRAVVEAIAAEAKRAAIAEARRRALAVLDRVMLINHADDPNFAALLECQARAREIRAAVLDPKGPAAQSASAITATTPAFAALLAMIEGRERLDDEKFASLEDDVTKSFGRPLAVAATRGKLVIRLAGPPRAPERAVAAPAAEEPVRPVATAPSRHVVSPVPPPVAATPPPPVAPPPPPPIATPPPPLAAGPEVAFASVVQDGGPAEAVGQAVLDEAAQWWVAAWARWASWKGTIEFKTAIKQELAKYSYLLSVPIQQSAEYEEGLLAYGFSILLDFVERQQAGIVTRAVNSLKTFVPDETAPTVGAHLYNFLITEGRLIERYPEFVKSVLVAAVPDPGVWTQARILESSAETRVFTHPSARLGDLEHNSQRLTSDRQRFTGHRFPVTLPPLTTRFFAVAADLREPRGIDVKLTEGRSDSDAAWLLTMPPLGRSDLQSSLIRLSAGGSSVPGLGKDYATLWVAVFNADPQAEKNYELILSLKKDASR